MNAFTSLKTLDRNDRRSLLLLFASGLLFWCSITTLLPTLPAYVEDLGGTTQQVGLVMGCLAIGLLLSRVWVGQLADRRGRKIVIMIGAVVAGLAPLGYLCVHTMSPLMAIRAFHGISISAFTTGYSALVVDLSPAEKRGELIGYMSLSVPIGMALGPALGGYLQESSGYTALFLVSATSGFFSLLLASWIREKPSIPQFPRLLGDEIEPIRSFWEILIHPALLTPSLVLLLVGLLFGTLATFLPLFIRQLHLSFVLFPQLITELFSIPEIKLACNAGLFYSVAAIASFSVRVFTGKASDRYGRGVFITGSLVCYGLAMILLTIGKTPEAFLLAAILEGAGGGILIPIMIALISDRSYPKERGRVYAVCVGGFDVGMALAGPILGYLSLIFNYRELFAIAASFAGIALVLFFCFANKNLAYSWRFALGRAKDLYATVNISC